MKTDKVKSVRASEQATLIQPYIQLGPVRIVTHFCSFAYVGHATTVDFKSNSQEVTEVETFSFNASGLIKVLH